jgi:DNA-binding FadR family transcriptional regulator
MSSNQSGYDFIEYLQSMEDEGEEPCYITLHKLHEELGISISRLREQMEVARAFGFIDVRPKKGIRRLPYTFSPAVFRSLSYALTLNPIFFESFSDLRFHIEAAYWHHAVTKLKSDDHKVLRNLVDRAWMKLRGTPIQIPQGEHRELHLHIFRRLDNPFVIGILEAYWDAYEEVGLNLYADYDYLEEVWTYHETMVEAICAGENEKGFNALIEHADLLIHRVNRNSAGNNVITYGNP